MNCDSRMPGSERTMCRCAACLRVRGLDGACPVLRHASSRSQYRSTGFAIRVRRAIAFTAFPAVQDLVTGVAPLLYDPGESCAPYKHGPHARKDESQNNVHGIPPWKPQIVPQLPHIHGRGCDVLTPAPQRGQFTYVLRDKLIHKPVGPGWCPTTFCSSDTGNASRHTVALLNSSTSESFPTAVIELRNAVWARNGTLTHVRITRVHQTRIDYRGWYSVATKHLSAAGIGNVIVGESLALFAGRDYEEHGLNPMSKARKRRQRFRALQGGSLRVSPTLLRVANLSAWVLCRST